MGLLSSAIYALDTPGALTRGVLAGKPGTRMAGRELLEQYGLLKPNRPGLDAGDVGGFMADVVLDPLTWFGGALASKGLKYAGKAMQARKAATAAAPIRKAATAATEAPGYLAETVGSKAAAEAAPVVEAVAKTVPAPVTTAATDAPGHLAEAIMPAPAHPIVPMPTTAAVPVSKAVKSVVPASDLKAMLDHITSDNYGTLRSGIDSAHSSLTKDSFRDYMKQVGIPVSGTKKQMREQADAYVQQLARTQTQVDAFRAEGAVGQAARVPKKEPRAPIDQRLEDVFPFAPEGAGAAATGAITPWQAEVVARAAKTTPSTPLELPSLFAELKAKFPSLTEEEFKRGMVALRDTDQLRLHEYTRAPAEIAGKLSIAEKGMDPLYYVRGPRTAQAVIPVAAALGYGITRNNRA